MDNQVHDQTVSFIGKIVDDCLRDVYVYEKYYGVILPMKVIRHLDALLEDTKLAVLTIKKQLDAAKIDNQRGRRSQIYPAECSENLCKQGGVKIDEGFRIQIR